MAGLYLPFSESRTLEALRAGRCCTTSDCKRVSFTSMSIPSRDPPNVSIRRGCIAPSRKHIAHRPKTTEKKRITTSTYSLSILALVSLFSLLYREPIKKYLTRFRKPKGPVPLSVNYHFTRFYNFSCGFCLSQRTSISP
jgi:hypothetical protein